MGFGIYEAKVALRTPIIWFGRRRWKDELPSVKWRLEHTLYRRKARQAWAVAAIDPMHLYRADLDETSVVLDLGAYRGDIARDIHKLYGCQVYAFEPVPEYHADAEKLFARNPKVSTFEYGLGGADTTLLIDLRGQGSTVLEDRARDHTEDTVEIQIRDIAAVLDELGLERVDLIKLNIEGAEYDVLERMLETGWMERTRYFLIQFHEGYKGAEIRRWRIRRRLRRTHEQIWNYPWVYELWCSKDQPHPQRPKLNRRERAKSRERLLSGTPIDPDDPFDTGDAAAAAKDAARTSTRS